MKRFICCFFSFVILFFACLPLTEYPVHAATLRNRKVVSVVYDDSGSMEGSNWAYANYAMQTFVAMLNEDDELYITYMSDENNAVKIATDDLPNAVTEIREHDFSGATPYNSVITAMDQLKNVNDTNPNTQYWLVVFTDGGFNDESNKNVTKDLERFNSKKMANGTTPQIMYMSIGDDSDSYTPHPSDKDITVISAQNEVDVRDSLFDIASRVTGRVRIEDKDITLKDSNTMTFSSNVPLFNISILVQNKNISVKSIKDSDGQEIPIKYEIPLRMPDPSISQAVGIKEMFGAVTLAGQDQGNISAGDYTITFSDSISREDIVIMMEPAIQLKIRVMVDGQEVTDLDDISVMTGNISTEAAIYEYGTDNIIMESLLPGDVTKKSVFSVDGKDIKKSDSLSLDKITAEEGNNIINVSLDIEGFFHLETSVEFTPKLIPNIDKIEAELSYDGSPRAKLKGGTQDADNVVYISKLDSNRTGIRFTIYQDGAPIDRSTAKSIEKPFKDNIQSGLGNLKVEVQNDGSFLVYPSKLPWYMPMELYWLKHHGDQKIGVQLDSCQAEGTLNIKYLYSLGELPGILIPKLVILYIIWWILFKKHFPKCTLAAANGERNNLGRVSYSDLDRIDLNWFGCFQQSNIFVILYNLIVLVLPMAPKKRFCGYTFTGQSSLVSKSYALKVRNVRGKAVDTTSTRPNEISQEASIELFDTLFIRNGESYLKFYIDQ